MSLKEVPGKYLHTSTDSWWAARCPVPHCGKENGVDPARSFKPASACVHFQQLRIPGKPSAFLFNPKARAAVCPECGYKNSDLETMERHRKVYCPAIKTKTAAGKKSQKPHKPPAQETTEEPVKAPERKKSNPEARGSKGMKYAIIYSNSPASEDEIRVTFLVNEMDPKDLFDGYFEVTAKKALTETVTSLMRKASEFLASRKLKPLYEELSFNFVNRAALSDLQARAAFMKGLNKIIWESTHKKPVETVTGPGTETEAKGPLPAKLQEKRIIPEKADQVSVKSDEWRWRQPRNKVKNTKNIFFLEKCNQKIPIEGMLPRKRKCAVCKGKIEIVGGSWNTVSYGHSGMDDTNCRYYEMVFIAPSCLIERRIESDPFTPKIWGMEGSIKPEDFTFLLSLDLDEMGSLYSNITRENISIGIKKGAGITKEELLNSLFESKVPKIFIEEISLEADSKGQFHFTEVFS